jgi:hypothetical protein
MHQFKLALVPLLAAFALTGCNEVKGTFSASAPLELKLKKKTVTLVPGEYRAELSRNRKGDELKLEIRAGKDKNKLSLRLPETTRLPKGSGEFVLRAADTGQAWDVRGQVRVETTVGERERAWESCTIQYNRGYCGRYGRYPYDRYDPYYPHDPYDPYGDRWGRCGGYTYHGYREVEFRPVTTTQTVNLEFADAQTDETVGTFAGGREDVERRYEFMGACR